MKDAYKLFTLNNGVRVAWLPYKSEVSYAGIILNVGSSHEDETEYGIAHFIEHMLFKGTQKRNNHKIINYLETVGGELNAFTTKEETTVYAAFPKKYYRRAIDLISDITFSSTFPIKEIENERNVILDEITSYKDTPSENIFDEFDELVLKNHPLAHNILGTEKSLAAISHKELQSFHKQQYFNSSPVLFFMGSTPFDVIKALAEIHLGHYTFTPRIEKSTPLVYSPSNIQMEEDTYQWHYITGMPVPGYNSSEKTALLMLNSLLGGPSMNSRLNMSLREKNGIAYNVESSYISYADTGTISIYFGTDEKNMKRSLQLVNRELDKIRNNKLSSNMLTQLQKQFFGQIAIARENKENTFLTFGKNILRHNKVNSIQDLKSKIDQVTSSQLLELANQYLNPENFSNLTIT